MIEFCKNNYRVMFALVILWGFQFVLLPFTHYHPETVHSHSEDTDAHQHEGRFHSATLEAYAHLVKGHFSNQELDDHFHHSHSPEEQNENDSGFFVLAKNSKSFKQELTFNQVGHASRFEFSNPLVSVPAGSEIVFLKSRSSESSHSSRSPPHVIL